MDIRKAQKKDVQEFLTMKKEDFKEYSKLIHRRISATNYEIKKEFKRILETKSEVLLFAKNYTLGGFIHGTIKNKRARIEYIFVKREFRKNGIATALIQAFTKIARKNQVKDVYLKVNLKNSNAIKLYEKIGFKTSSYEMKKELIR